MGMGVLGRRIDRLLRAAESGKLSFVEGEPTLDELVADLSKVKRLPNGDIDLKTCSPLVRRLSRSFIFAEQVLSDTESPAPPELPEMMSPKAVEETQREYFRLLGDFFQAATGVPAERFEEKVSFGDRIRAEARTLAPRFQNAWNEHVPRIAEFYKKIGTMLLRGTKLYSGLNAVVGGLSTFPRSAFDGYRKMALYADTVFIPDPVLPWLETNREHEGFQHVRTLQACHDILRLRPLVDADLPYPAVIVFPSWEKSLEEQDETTQNGIGELALSFFSHFLDAQFEDESEVLEHITGAGGDAFRQAVKRHGLFIPPEADGPMSVDEGVKVYLEYSATWRTPEYCAQLAEQPPAALAWLLIMERLSPQFHIRDNARAMSAQPLLWNPTHYHYFNLCAAATNQRLELENVIDHKTVTLLAALNQPSLAWLGNVSVPDLVKLRQNNANETFRKALKEHLKGLNEADEKNLNRVAADVARGTASLIADHSREADKLWHEYKKRLMLTGGLAITGGIALSPWLAGLFGLAPGLAGLAGGLGGLAKDYTHYRLDKNNLSQSVLGILSAAKKEGRR